MSPTRTGLSGHDLNRLFAEACAAQAANECVQARDTFRLLLDYLPDAALLHSHLGLAHYGLAEFDQARAAFTRAVDLAPTDNGALFNLALCEKQAGDLVTAIASYCRLLTQTPEDVDCLYNLAGCYRETGDAERAIACYQEVLSLDENHPAAAAGLAHIHHGRGETDQAAAWYQHQLARQPDDEAARYLLDALTGIFHDHPPETYVRDLFDSCAKGFEKTLVTDLGYDNPVQLHGCLQRCPGHHEHYQHGLDLGCGTGLSGLPFCSLVAVLDGVDLSVNMLAMARDKGCYTTLHTDSIIHHLRATTETYDLFIATDVFIYIGDLRELFAATAAAARPGALFCCSTERMEADGYELRSTGRYAYCQAYLRDMAAAAGWCVLAREPTGLRREGDVRIAGDLWVLRFDPRHTAETA